jgi:hypothetical protein
MCLRYASREADVDAAEVKVGGIGDSITQRVLGRLLPLDKLEDCFSGWQGLLSCRKQSTKKKHLYN